MGEKPPMPPPLAKNAPVSAFAVYRYWDYFLIVVVYGESKWFGVPF